MIKLKDILNEFITKAELAQVEQKLDTLFRNVGMDIEFTKHFFDRLNHKRNGKEIEPEELLSIYTKTYKKYGSKMPHWRDNSEALLHDFNNDINIPFVLEFNKKTKELQMVAKTIMRTKNFKTSGQTLKV